MSKENEINLTDSSGDKYKYGFVTDIEADTIPCGLNADIIRMIRECDTLGYTGTYYLQYFFNAGHTLGNIAPPTRRYDRDMLNRHAPLTIGYRNFPEDRGK